MCGRASMGWRTRSSATSTSSARSAPGSRSITGGASSSIWRPGPTRSGDRPFTRESLMMVASCTKGAMATCVLMLVDAGRARSRRAGGDVLAGVRAGGKGGDPAALGAQPPGRAALSGPGGGAVGARPARRFRARPPARTPGAVVDARDRVRLSPDHVRSDARRGRAAGDRARPWARGSPSTSPAPLGLEFWIGLPPELDDRVAPGVWPEDRDAWAEELATPEPPAGTYAARRRAAIARCRRWDPTRTTPPRGAPTTASRCRPRTASPTRGRSRECTPPCSTTSTASGCCRPACSPSATTPQTDGLPALIESGTAGPDIRFGLGYSSHRPACLDSARRRSATPAPGAVSASPTQTSTSPSPTSVTACATSARAAIRAGPRCSTPSAAPSEPSAPSRPGLSAATRSLPVPRGSPLASACSVGAAALLLPPVRRRAAPTSSRLRSCCLNATAQGGSAAPPAALGFARCGSIVTGVGLALADRGGSVEHQAAADARRASARAGSLGAACGRCRGDLGLCDGV